MSCECIPVDDNLRLRVKNLKNTSKNRAKCCGTWSNHWRKWVKNKTRSTCSVVGCTEEFGIGAHVKLDCSNKWFIAPFCAKHNNRSFVKTVSLERKVELVESRVDDCKKGTVKAISADILLDEFLKDIAENSSRSASESDDEENRAYESSDAKSDSDDNVAAIVDRRCAIVRSADLSFNQDGEVRKNCKAVNDGRVILNLDGTISKQSPAMKDGTLRLKDAEEDINFCSLQATMEKLRLADLYVYVTDLENKNGKYHNKRDCHGAQKRMKLQRAKDERRLPCEKCS